MNKEITLNQFIAELQKYQAEYGDKEFISVGGCSGQVEGLRAPHHIRLREPGTTGLGDIGFFIPSFQEDLNVHFEVQTYNDKKGYDMLTCNDYDTFAEAYKIYRNLKRVGVFVCVVKVNEEGMPIDEIVANFGH